MRMAKGGGGGGGAMGAGGHEKTGTMGATNIDEQWIWSGGKGFFQKKREKKEGTW